jgi:hypothetical protein
MRRHLDHINLLLFVLWLSSCTHTQPAPKKHNNGMLVSEKPEFISTEDYGDSFSATTTRLNDTLITFYYDKKGRKDDNFDNSYTLKVYYYTIPNSDSAKSDKCKDISNYRFCYRENDIEDNAEDFEGVFTKKKKNRLYIGNAAINLSEAV